jgi:hypothetical protein
MNYIYIYTITPGRTGGSNSKTSTQDGQARHYPFIDRTGRIDVGLGRVQVGPPDHGLNCHP